MTPEDVRKLREKAKPGPWIVAYNSEDVLSGGDVLCEWVAIDAAFIRLNDAAPDMANLIVRMDETLKVADMLLSAGNAMSRRLRHVVGPESVVRHWDAIALAFTTAREKLKFGADEETAEEMIAAIREGEA